MASVKSSKQSKRVKTHSGCCDKSATIATR